MVINGTKVFADEGGIEEVEEIPQEVEGCHIGIGVREREIDGDAGIEVIAFPIG